MIAIAIFFRQKISTVSLWGKYDVFVRDFPYQFFQAVARKCSVKKGLRPATLLKKRLWHRCFLVNFAKFIRTYFLTEYLRWLLLLSTYSNSHFCRHVFNTFKKVFVCLIISLFFGCVFFENLE